MHPRSKAALLALLAIPIAFVVLAFAASVLLTGRLCDVSFNGLVRFWDQTPDYVKILVMALSTLTGTMVHRNALARFSASSLSGPGGGAA